MARAFDRDGACGKKEVRSQKLLKGRTTGSWRGECQKYLGEYRNYSRNQGPLKFIERNRKGEWKKRRAITREGAERSRRGEQWVLPRNIQNSLLNKTIHERSWEGGGLVASQTKKTVGGVGLRGWFIRSGRGIKRGKKTTFFFRIYVGSFTRDYQNEPGGGGESSCWGWERGAFVRGDFCGGGGVLE